MWGNYVHSSLVPGAEPDKVVISPDGQFAYAFDARPNEPFYKFSISQYLWTPPTAVGVGGNAGAADIPGTQNFAVGDSYGPTDNTNVYGYNQSGSSLGPTVLPFYDFSLYSPVLQDIVVNGDGSEGWALTDIGVFETTGGGYGQAAYALGLGQTGTTFAGAVTADDKTLFVTSGSDNTVTPVTGGNSLSVGTPIAVGTAPVAVAITPDQAPVASLKVTLGPPGTPTSFDATASTAPDGSISSYAWNFGDGSTETTPTPFATHTYTTPGPITATVTVTSADGTSTSQGFTGQTMVRNGGPSAIASALVVQPIAGTPNVYGLSPASSVGGTGGGTVTITGSNFNSVTGVSFGGTAATYTVNSPTSITATVPAAAGPPTVDVQVTNPDGTSVANPADQYTYLPLPAPTSVSCTSASCSVQAATTGAVVSATVTTTSGTCSGSCVLNAGVIDQPELTVPSPTCTATSSIPAGYAQYIANSEGSVISSMVSGLQETNWISQFVGVQPTSAAQAAQIQAALKLVTVCWDTGVPVVQSNDGRVGATKVPKPALKACSATKPVPPCVMSKSLTDGTFAVSLDLPTTSAGSTFWLATPATTIKSVPKAAVSVGASITIKGKNLALASSASIGGVPAIITAVDSKSMTLTVPTGAETGPVSLVTHNGVVVSTTNVTVS